ncbi:glycosyltransferase [Polynucleobacter sp. AP-Melu-500A-A1]|uniref:glycosyltransferase n=1 Tax=Polynucleobacter sp. AP-Melu-500A-A1 TaxID=2576929 RepID=UPI001C0DD27E|nr:glycosyltransferase [Polynucleobacter sp. AP-Melu-500A-A1]MBU3630038.1 glycosyltransferase [Polynucleobacter sp. AP-Melu-500A-A1]
MLSIITINKDNLAGLRQTIESIKQLPRNEFEWICIDSVSTDGSVALAQEFAGAGDVVISERDSGIYNAMNKGVQAARGDQILFLNSGDTLAPQITSISGLGCDPSMDLNLFGFQIRDQIRLPRMNLWRFWSMPTSHQAIIYSRALLLVEPFDESYRFAADFEHYLRINRKPLKMKRIARTLIVNEPYGSDQHLPKLLAEYRHALMKNGCPSWWAHFVFWLKTHYLKRALKIKTQNTSG